jgi:hypothetical protein
LRDVDPSTGDVGATAHVDDPANCAAVQTHTQLELDPMFDPLR